MTVRERAGSHAHVETRFVGCHNAEAVNEYAAKLQGKVAIYAMIVPTAQTYYLPSTWTGRVHHEPANINATYAMLDPSVTSIDVVGSLSGHERENIYFRTEHHWTSLAAYYAYSGFCKAAGFKPISLDPANKRTTSPSNVGPRARASRARARCCKRAARAMACSSAVTTR